MELTLTPYQWFCNLVNQEYCEVSTDSRKALVVVRLTVIKPSKDIYLVARQKTLEQCIFQLWEEYRNLTENKLGDIMEKQNE